MKKVAIHHRANSFSELWIEYCEVNQIAYKLVDCFDSQIIELVEDCAALLWHWHHTDWGAQKFARQLTLSLEHSGKVVFPSSMASWHFDDKIGQKYLFDALKIDSVPTWIFYEREAAENWVETAQFPKVFKLSVGAGSDNVSLVYNKEQAKQIVKKMFDKGLSRRPFVQALQQKIISFARNPNNLTLEDLAKVTKKNRSQNFKKLQIKNIEKGYAYFQEYIPGNNHDIRVVVIDEKAFAIKRMVREGDFRASGSGRIVHDRAQIPIECIVASFEFAEKSKSECVALDFVLADGKPLIIEASYAFSVHGYRDCPGYWTKDLAWCEGHFRPEYFMLDSVFRKIGLNI
jgi:glutathione synthase/RimK-type ligase-like ATP-grasp enzyme